MELLEDKLGPSASCRDLSLHQILTWRFMGLSKYSYKYFKWGYR